MTQKIPKGSENELQWYPQQPQQLMFTNLSDACCEAKRWKHLLNLTWLYTKACQTFSRTFSGTLLKLTWLCSKASQTSVEPDLALHQRFPGRLRNRT
jgi:hypothetical protein